MERVQESRMITSEQLQLGVILEERVVKPSVRKLEGQVSFECGSRGRLTENKPSDDVRAHEAFMVPKSEHGSDMGGHH